MAMTFLNGSTTDVAYAVVLASKAETCSSRG